MTWDGKASVQFLLKRREAVSLFHPLKTCSASKACEHAGHTGLPPSRTVVLGSLNGQLDFPSVRRHLLKGRSRTTALNMLHLFSISVLHVFVSFLT